MRQRQAEKIIIHGFSSDVCYGFAAFDYLEDERAFGTFELEIVKLLIA